MNLLIVGAASGIGRALVDRLLKETQHLVIAADIDSLRLNELKIHVSRPFDALKIDISDSSSIEQAFSELQDKYKQLDAVVITAAMHSSYPAEYLTDAMIDHMFLVNLSGHIKLVRTLLPLIRKGGRLIGLSSIAAGIAVPMESLYSASKAGLEAFYEALAIELSYRPIHVSIIHPGNVNTGFNEKGNDYKEAHNPFITDGYKRVVARIDSSKGMPASKVAAVIMKALHSKTPKFCYVVGTNAWKATMAVRILGRNWALKLMAKFFGF